MTTRAPGDDDVIRRPSEKETVQEDDAVEEDAREERSLTGTIIFFGLGIAALGVIGYLLFTWFFGGEPATQQESALPDLGITLSEIAGEPENFFGERVVVSGEVSEPLIDSPAAFVIGGDGFYGSQEVLVIGMGPVVAAFGSDAVIGESDLVQVEGVVRDFEIAAFEDEIGADLDDAAFEEFEGQAAILATAIDLVPGVRLEADQVGEGAAPDIAPFVIGDDAAVIEQFALFEGYPVIALAQAANVLGPDAFVTDDEVLVLTVASDTELLEGANTLVSGTVRAFELMEIETELGVDLDDEALTGFDGEPVIIAESVVVLTPITQITEDPAAFAGLAPTVLGEITEVISPNAFVVDEELLIVVAEPHEDLIEQASALATGEVSAFNLVEVEQELGIDLDDAAFEGWEGRPAIMATELEVIR